MGTQEGENGQVTRDTCGSGQGLGRVDPKAGPDALEVGEKEAGEASRDNMGSQLEGSRRTHAWAVGLGVRMAS